VLVSRGVDLSTTLTCPVQIEFKAAYRTLVMHRLRQEAFPRCFCEMLNDSMIGDNFNLLSIPSSSALSPSR
jgi:hypothetical protein